MCASKRAQISEIYIPLYTNNFPKVFRTLFVAHNVFFLQILFVCLVESSDRIDLLPVLEHLVALPLNIPDEVHLHKVQSVSALKNSLPTEIIDRVF